MREPLRKQIDQSFFLHFPLKADDTKSIDYKNIHKVVEKRLSVWNGMDSGVWKAEGEGETEFSDSGKLKVHTYPTASAWPETEARAVDAVNGSYATFGSYILTLTLGNIDTSEYNRIRFLIKPECHGQHSPIVRVGFTNDGCIKIPDRYSREGFNALNLINNEWNECIWEIDGIAHDAMREISFNFHRYGKEVTTGSDLWFELDGIELQKAEPNVVIGWECKENTAVFSTSGYLLNGPKTAIANTSLDTFSLKDEDGNTVYSGDIRKINNSRGEFSVLDFTPFSVPGVYQIVLGDWRSTFFEISDEALDGALWKLLNFLFCERCGYPVPGKHGTCHQDVYAVLGEEKIPFTGGWHDAADVSQQTVQSAEILDSLMTATPRLTGKEMHLADRIAEEAYWAMDFVLRMDLGDGRIVTNSAIRRWTDNHIGNMDDDPTVDVRSNPLDGFIISAVEAHGAEYFASIDNEVVWKCRDNAARLFRIAWQNFIENGLEEPHPLEYTTTGSLSQYYAAAAIASSRLYTITGDKWFADIASESIDYVLKCQEAGDKAPLRGFFYRDDTKSAIVHFSHQSRDYIFAMALDEACHALKSCCDVSKWEASLRLHGEYFKSLMQYTAPYGMIPAGLFHVSEAGDEETFIRSHRNVKLANERDNYIRQLENGISLGGGYFIKAFPVWFSFRGNSAIHLAMGKAASIIGRYFGDEELKGIAMEQLYWTLGKNPFGQSLIYGEGENYGRNYSAFLGETVGEIPVGVQTRGNEDVPYWPPACVATYREIWTTPAGKWFWIASDIL